MADGRFLWPVMQYPEKHIHPISMHVDMYVVPWLYIAPLNC